MQDVLCGGAGWCDQDLIDALLTLASTEQGFEHHELVDLASVARRALAHRANEARVRGLHVTADLASTEVNGDRRLIEC